MSLPNFVIIGTPRAGTTTLYHHLSEHPEVHMASVKEVRFFDRHWDKGLPWYEEQLAGASTGQLTGEATPLYMSNPEAMSRLTSTMPEAKLVAILRNPAEATHSFFHYRSARDLDSGTLEQALDRESQNEPGAFPYLDVRNYSKHLDFIENDLGRQVSVLFYDDLADHQSKLFSALADALNISDFNFAGPARVVNAADRFRSVRLRRWARRAPTPIAKIVGRLNRVPQPNAPLADATRRRIVDSLGTSIEALEARTGRDLSDWK